MAHLDSLSKILLATSSINYMANIIASTQGEIERIIRAVPESATVHQDSVVNFQSALDDAIMKLTDIMNDLGNCLNESGATSSIDSHVTSASFDILNEPTGT